MVDIVIMVNGATLSWCILLWSALSWFEAVKHIVVGMVMAFYGATAKFCWWMLKGDIVAPDVETWIKLHNCPCKTRSPCWCMLQNSYARNLAGQGHNAAIFNSQRNINDQYGPYRNEPIWSLKVFSLFLVFRVTWSACGMNHSSKARVNPSWKYDIKGSSILSKARLSHRFIDYWLLIPTGTWWDGCLLSCIATKSGNITHYTCMIYNLRAWHSEDSWIQCGTYW